MEKNIKLGEGGEGEKKKGKEKGKKKSTVFFVNKS